MGRQNVIPPRQLETAKALGADWQLTPVRVNTATRVGFSITTSDVTDNTGTFGVEHRVWQDDNHVGPWVTLTLDSPPTLADADDNFLIDASVPPGQLRLTFTAAGSTPDGTAEVWLTGCEEGA